MHDAGCGLPIQHHDGVNDREEEEGHEEKGEFFTWKHWEDFK